MLYKINTVKNIQEKYVYICINIYYYFQFLKIFILVSPILYTYNLFLKKLPLFEFCRVCFMIIFQSSKVLSELLPSLPIQLNVLSLS